MIKSLFRSILRLFGWKLEHESVPDYGKAVLVFAPHTSNWDFVTMVCAKFALDVKVRYLGKHTLFRPPIGWFFRALGGIPVERSENRNMVDQVNAIIEKEEQCLLALSPEGTRSFTHYWKTGFYHIAHRAQIPIVMFYLDRPTKVIGFAEPFDTSGDIEADFVRIADFYADKEGFIPEYKSVIQTKQTYLKSRNNEEPE